MDTYKQICAKLVKAWDDTADGEYEDFGRAASYLVDWTRAALAEPKPPSLKEQALALINGNSSYLDDDAMSVIRRALESLPD